MKVKSTRVNLESILQKLKYLGANIYQQMYYQYIIYIKKIQYSSF